jgi:probable HAF family extracellular repeat protein
MRSDVLRAFGPPVLAAVLACREGDTTTTGPEAELPLASSAVSYVAMDLGALPGQMAGGSANDVNDSMQVAGVTAFGDGSSPAFLWEKGRMRNLGTLGGDWSTAAALNNKGQVVGTSARSDGRLRASRWTNGKMLDLGTLGGRRRDAADVNDKGHTVGWSQLPVDPRFDPETEPVTHAFLWRNGKMIDLGTLGGTNSRGHAINDSGYVVGESETATGDTHAFLWKNGVVTDLGGAAGFSFARGINAGRQVVGFGNAGVAVHSFLWSKGKLTDLGTFGGSAGLARAINRAGRIVGGVDPSGLLRQAFTHKDGVTTLLPALAGGRTAEALSINRNGDIAGYSEGTTLRVNRPTLWLKQ